MMRLRNLLNTEEPNQGFGVVWEKSRYLPMKVKHHLIERTPFGIQETFITDTGHLELWGDDSKGYRWRFTSQYQPPRSDKKTYSNRPAAMEAAASFVNES